MSNENELQTPETADVESFVMDPETAQNLSPEEIAQKRVDFYKGLLKKERSKNNQKQQELQTDVVSTDKDIDQRLTETEMRVELRMNGRTVDEIREIEKYAKGAGLSLLEAEKSPAMQAYINQNQEKIKSQEATMEPSGHNVRVGDKNAKDVLSDPSATPQAKQEAFQAMMRSGVKR